MKLADRAMDEFTVEFSVQLNEGLAATLGIPHSLGPLRTANTIHLALLSPYTALHLWADVRKLLFLSSMSTTASNIRIYNPVMRAPAGSGPGL